MVPGLTYCNGIYKSISLFLILGVIKSTFTIHTRFLVFRLVGLINCSPLPPWKDTIVAINRALL